MSSQSVLRYGIVSKTATYWNAYVALDQGFYAREGLDVQFTATGSTAATIRAVVTGAVDLGGCSPDELISARAEGQDLVIVGGVINRPVSRIVGLPGMRSLGDLIGKRVGVNQIRGSVSMVMKAALHDAGLPEGSCRLIEAGTTPEMAQKLRDGEIDAAMLTAPFDMVMLADGFSSLADVGRLFPRYAFTTVNARRGWVDAHPEEVAAFFRATRSAGMEIGASRRQKQRVLSPLGRHTGLTGSALEQTYGIYQAPGVLSRRGEIRPGALQAVIGLMEDQGLLPGRRPLVRELVAPRWR